MYSFREIICHRCNHRFVHLAHSLPGNSSYDEYRKADTNELLDYAVCPECACEMVIPANSYVGVDPKSDGITRTAVRGI